MIICCDIANKLIFFSDTVLLARGCNLEDYNIFSGKLLRTFRSNGNSNGARVNVVRVAINNCRSLVATACVDLYIYLLNFVNGKSRNMDLFSKEKFSLRKCSKCICEKKINKIKKRTTGYSYISPNSLSHTVRMRTS